MRGFEVIVSEYVNDCVVMRSQIRVIFPDLPTAAMVGRTHKRGGSAVIIRPNFNEQDNDGKFFREWRSFNGEAWRECRWNISNPIA